MRYILMFMLCVSFSHNSLSAENEFTLNIGDTAPDWSLQTNNNESLNYYEDSGSDISLILFWATWCPYCAKLMPHLEDIYRKYQHKNVKFYAIDIYEDGDINPSSYFKDKGYTYTMLLNGDNIAKQYAVKGTPSVYLVDTNKTVIYKRRSGDSETKVRQKLDSLLSQILTQ